MTFANSLMAAAAVLSLIGCQERQPAHVSRMVPGTAATSQPTERRPIANLSRGELVDFIKTRSAELKFSDRSSHASSVFQELIDLRRFESIEEIAHDLPVPYQYWLWTELNRDDPACIATLTRLYQASKERSVRYIVAASRVPQARDALLKTAMDTTADAADRFRAAHALIAQGDREARAELHDLRDAKDVFYLLSSPPGGYVLGKEISKLLDK